MQLSVTAAAMHHHYEKEDKVDDLIVIAPAPSPTGVDAFDTHHHPFNFCTPHDNSKKPSSTKANKLRHDFQHNHEYAQKSSPLYSSAPPQIQAAATKFINKPTIVNWDRLVHLFRVDRRRREGRMREKQVMGLSEEDVVDVKLEEQATCEERLQQQLHDGVLQEEKESSPCSERDSNIETSLVDNDDYEDEEEDELSTVVGGEKEKEDDADYDNVAGSSIYEEEEPTAATAATLHVKKISLNKSSSTTTTERSSSDWMGAFRLIYQLLFVSNALIQLAAFLNRFRNMRTRKNRRRQSCGL